MINRETILAYFSEGNTIKTVRVCIKSLHKKGDREYAMLSTGELVGLDQIKSINGITL